MDRLTPEQRHRCMSRIRSKNTAPEWAVRRLVFALGYRYRLHVKTLPGKPDLVLPRLHKVIFVHGCFWHAHGCRANLRPLPATRTAFWKEKLTRNIGRDREVLRALWQTGWQVLVVWECQTRDAQQLRLLLTDFLSSAPPPVPYDLADQHTLYGMAAEPPETYNVRKAF